MNTGLKCLPPPLRRQRVQRRRLLARLNDSLTRPLTLVIAPAGFGKTTLLAEWVENLEMPVAWLTLTARENNPQHFQRLVVAALRVVNPQLSTEQVRAITPVNTESYEGFGLSLLNALDTIDVPHVFVLDDFHVITDTLLHRSLTFVIENLPPMTRMVLGSRTDPILPISRLRARDQLIEIRAGDLRFTAEETATFLNEIMGLAIDAETVRALEARTEGWIAGLQLAALTLRENDDASAVLAEITGNHRYIRDFLVEEVFERQPAPVQQFLLQTSVVDSFSAALCNAITEGDNGQAMLEELERTNLFLTPLDLTRTWYRYHQLFGDFLQARLEEAEPALVPTLHRRAASWYAEQSTFAQAVEHILAAGDFEQTAQMFTEHWLEIFNSVHSFELQKLLARIPEDITWTHPYLALVQTLLLVVMSQWDAAATGVARLRELDPGNDPAFVNCTRLMHGYIRFVQGEHDEGIALAEQVLADMSEESEPLYIDAHFYLGEMYEKAHRFDAAHHNYTRLADFAARNGYVTLQQNALSQRVLIEMKMGANPQAIASCRAAIELGVQNVERPEFPLPSTARPYIYLAHLLYETNELDEALVQVQAGLACADRWETYFPIEGRMRLACIHQALGQREQADAIMDTALKMATRALARARQRDTKFDMLQAFEHLAYWSQQIRAHMWLMVGDLESLLRWVAQRGLDFDKHNSYMIEPRLSILQGYPERTLPLLESLLEHAIQTGQPQKQAVILSVRACAYFVANALQPALDDIDRALALGEPRGLVRTYLDIAPVMVNLLQHAAQHGIRPDTIAHMLSAETTPRRSLTAPPSGSQLTARDQDVLRLIAAGLTNREIADELVLTVGTVKWYCNSIYSKLGVRNRVQAVERARELDLF